MIGDESAGKRGVLEPEGDIVEVLLNRELANGGNAGVVDLDFVGGLRRLCQRHPQRGAG